MPLYQISADVTVGLAMTVRASSEAEARELFRDNIAMNASLVGLSTADWVVHYDDITDVEGLRVTPGDN